MAQLPLTGWPKCVLQELIRYIEYIANRREINEFYIGRGIDLDERRRQHGCDDIIALYETDSIDNAIEVENALINRFYGHPKCSNDAPHGGGGVSEEYKYQVYLAIWF